MCEKSFKWRINELYREYGLSIQKFADECKLSRQSMQYYLSGERMPDSACLQKICTACNVSADWLLALTDIRTLEVDKRNAIEYTGLPESMIDRIKVSYSQTEINALADLIEDEMFPYLLRDYAFFLKLLSHIDSYDEFDDVNSTEVTDDKKVIMSFSSAKSLLASQVSNDLAEICRHKEQSLLVELIEVDGDHDEGKEENF